MRDDHEDGDPVTVLARRLPDRLERRVLVLRPGETRHIAHPEWANAFVVLEHGHVELADTAGRRLHLQEGASFTAPGGVVTVTATGRGQTVLALIRRTA